MTSEELRWRRWQPVVAVGLYGLLLLWLVVVGLAPVVLDVAPWPLAWLAMPGSAGAMTIALALSAVAFGTLVATRWQAKLRIPFLLSAWCAVSALPLAFAAYLPCAGSAPPFWDALSNTFGLFLGSFESPFGSGEACGYAVPLGLQLARLLAIVATLTGATSVLFTLYRSQLDRLGMLRARRLVAVIGVDDSSWPLLQRLARGGDVGRRTVLLTSDPAAFAEQARAIGVLVLRTGADDPLGLREGFAWHRTVRCYLLSPDAALNRTRATLLRSTVPGLDRPPEHRLTVVARIDDPWHADDFRKRFIGDPGFVFDALGSYEATAEALVERVRRVPDVSHLLVVGGGRLVLALLAELSQLGRELQFLDEGGELPQVWLLDSDANELAGDHRVRQQRFTVDPLRLTPSPGREGLPELETALAQVAAASGVPVVVIARSGSRLGTRLAVRRPDLAIFELAGGNRPLADDEPVVGRLASFTLALSQPSGRSADAWERAAWSLHERYRRRFPTARLALPWDELPEFYRESNRRLLASVLDGMVALGRTWAPTGPEAASAEVAAGPPGVTTVDDEVRMEQGRRLFGLSAAELSALAAAEHESWRQHYLANGWRPGPRDDPGRRHPDLMPWADLPTSARAKTEAGAVDTLVQLRALGYRATVPHAEAGWTFFRRVGRVQARRLRRPLQWLSSDGAELTGAAGDWLVTDPTGGRRTVTAASFVATHRQLRAGVWERIGTVRARPVVPGEVVETQEGRTVAGAAGWLLSDGDDHRWIVGPEHFLTAYRPVGLSGS